VKSSRTVDPQKKLVPGQWLSGDSEAVYKGKSEGGMKVHMRMRMKMQVRAISTSSFNIFYFVRWMRVLTHCPLERNCRRSNSHGFLVESLMLFSMIGYYGMYSCCICQWYYICFICWTTTQYSFCYWSYVNSWTYNRTFMQVSLLI